MTPLKERKLFAQIAKIRLLFSGQNHEFLLNDLLSQDLKSSPLPEKMLWLEQVLQWLFRGEREQDETRFRYLFKTLEKNPEWHLHFQETFTGLLRECGFLTLFTNVGIATEHGLWGDIVQRLMQKFVPVGGKTDFQEILVNVFQSEDYVLRISALSLETLRSLNELLFLPEAGYTWEPAKVSARNALLLLSGHLTHYAASKEIWRRLPKRRNASESPFFRLALIFQGATNTGMPPNELVPVEGVLDSCENDVAHVYTKMENSGVSVDVVNRLETMSAILHQIRAIQRVSAGESKDDRLRDIQSFLALAVAAGIEGNSIVRYVRRHFYLLSRKIAERNGHSGEHYFARSRQELVTLFGSAFGGGIIVVLMTILKTLLFQYHWAPLFLATGVWLIYATGFLSMQALGCTLATKIPSFTAFRLSEILKNLRKESLKEFRDEFWVVVRSQAVALAGNLAGVIPFVLLIDYVFQLAMGRSFMHEHYAQHVVNDLNPIWSYAVPLGALTGVLLWLSSLAGGWFENWIVFNRVPSGLENHFRFKKIFGDKIVRRFVHLIEKHSSGIATNISLGFLFGFVPMFGALFGVNWNGNHVTISTASAVFACASLNFDFAASDWVYLVGGLLLIGVMNFVVSFGLALYVAGNAQKMKFFRVMHYLKASFSLTKLKEAKEVDSIGALENTKPH